MLQGVCGEVAIEKGIKAGEGQITQETDHTCHTKEMELGLQQYFHLILIVIIQYYKDTLKLSSHKEC